MKKTTVIIDDSVACKETGLLCKPEMVTSIIEDRKHVTRRLRGLKQINKRPDAWKFSGWIGNKPEEKRARFYKPGKAKELKNGIADIKCPYGCEGDLIYVRETTWQKGQISAGFYNDNEPKWEAYLDEDGQYVHCFDQQKPKDEGFWTWKKVAGLFMPKAVARVWLQITSVRLERLQEIPEEDAIQEGVLFYSDILGLHYKDYIADASGYGDPDHDYPTVSTAKESFKTLWVKINGLNSWKLNPWIWVIHFTKIEK